MSNTYRAAYFDAKNNGVGVVMTAPEHAGLSEPALIAEAMAEADRMGLIGTQEHQLSKADFRAGLVIGQWRD